MNGQLFDPDEPKPSSGRKIRSDPAQVRRQDAWLDQRQREKPSTVYRTRRYVNGPNANPGWVCQGGLPSLGEDY